jgi:hypothetical protein
MSKTVKIVLIVVAVIIVALVAYRWYSKKKTVSAPVKNGGSVTPASAPAIKIATVKEAGTVSQSNSSE